MLNDSIVLTRFCPSEGELGKVRVSPYQIKAIEEVHSEHGEFFGTVISIWNVESFTVKESFMEIVIIIYKLMNALMEERRTLRD